MADDGFEPGEMDIAEQERTFHGFMRWTVNIAIACIAVLIFLAIFAT